MSDIGPLRKAAPSGAAFLLLLALFGCAMPERFGGSRSAVIEWSQARGFKEIRAAVGGFQLLALLRGPRSQQISIYIEGDGAPWPNAYTPPIDPTPLQPVALALAAADHSGTVVYLGRPCQYLDPAALRVCNSAFWIGRRFAPEVVAAYDDALNRLKRIAGASRIRLVGYSGGGVLATLLAAQRKDVDLLVTVASPLALEEWATWHGVSPLSGSLDPAELAQNKPLPRSVHFVGASDRTVPAKIVEHFVRRKGGRIERVAGFNHECCWIRDWAALLRQANEVKETK